jgi:hypothetical protein
VDFLNRLKKEMTEGIVRAILDDAGYRAVGIGIEQVLREIRCLSAAEYGRLEMPGALRRLPDLTVMNREQTEVFLVEVKYRGDWNKSVFYELQDQVAEFGNMIVVSINANPPNPKAMQGLPSRHLRCCRVRKGWAQMQVELGKRDSDGGGCEWVDLDAVADEHLWWKMSRLQDVFAQVQERRDDQTLNSAIDALGGIVNR